MPFLSRIFKNANTSSYFPKNHIKNEIKHNNFIYKRLGWLKNPLSSVNYNIPVYNDHNKNTIESCVDVDKKFINKIIETKNNYNSDGLNPSFYDLGVEYLDMLYNYSMKSPSQSEILNNKIKQILELRFNYNHIVNDYKLHSRGHCSRNNIDYSNTFEIPDGKCANMESIGVLTKSDDKQTEKMNEFDLNNFKNKNPEFLDYLSIRKSSGLYEKSNSFLIRVSGSNSDYFLNQILSTSVSKMYLNEVEYSCLLDSKGVILDTCFIIKFDDHYLLISTGNKRNEVYDYISSYIVHLRGFGMDLLINPVENMKVCTLYGPLSIDVLKSLLSDECSSIKIQNLNEKKEKNNLEILKNLMKSFNMKFGENEDKIICYRVSDVEDGFEFILSSEYYSDFVKHIGFKAYDIARLESGLIRPDVDLTPESTPMHTSLMWNLDVQKVRNRSVFGHKQFGHNMVEGVSKMRVGLITNKMVTPSCTILTKSSRMPIGNITSTAYSPALGMYISHCYVNTDYAKHDTPIIISVPDSPDSDVSKAKFKKYYRNKILKTFYMGTIVRLPFINPSYRIKNMEIKNRKNNDQKINTHKYITETSESDLIVKNENKNEIKTKKQIWKEIIKKHKKKINGTLEMAFKKWEREEVDQYYGKEIQNKNKDNNYNKEIDKEDNKYNNVKDTTNIVPLSRINLLTSRNIGVVDILEYYKSRHEVPIVHRHRRYRPTVKTN